MTDYVFQVPSPNFIGCQRTSTAGDSTTQLDQWSWPPQALFNTPSKKRGMDLAEEIYLRARAVNWAVRICITLQLPQLIIATAAAYIHRFYMRKPLQKYSPKVMSATALFLATKVEEVPRKLEYVVREYLKIDEDGEEQVGVIPEDSQEFQVLKQQILYYEDILLCTLCFDLAVDHPYVPLVNNVKTIHEAHYHSRSPNESLSVELADRSKAKSITQAAWGFVNDSLMTPLCLFVKPELIAASAFLLAVSHRLSECPPPPSDGSQPHSTAGNDASNLDYYLNLPTNANIGNGHTPEPWWKVFQVESIEEIYPVANAMLDQYDSSVCDYIRERARHITRFPGPSLLCPPAQHVESPSKNSDAPSADVTDRGKAACPDMRTSHNNEDSRPEKTGQEELQPQEADKIHVVAQISEHNESHLPDVASTPDRMAVDAPLVNDPEQAALRAGVSQMDAKNDCQVPSPIRNEGPEELRIQEVLSHQAGNSTPGRHAMSDNMDLGTPVESNNSPSKSNPVSPPPRPELVNQLGVSPAKTPKKRSRSPTELDSTTDHHLPAPPKTPKLEHIPPTSSQNLPLPTLTPTTHNTTVSISENVAVPSSSTNLTRKNQESESSLSDMEDGELD